MRYAAISANASLARSKGHAVRPQRLRDFSRSGGDRAFDLEFAPFARYTKMFRMSTPEELARQNIDALLEKCGWTLQTRSTINLDAARGVAIREALLKGGDEADYLLFVDRKAIGTVEAKPEGHTLIGVEEQSGKYGKNLLDVYGKWREPLPFAYESTGVETQFTNQLDPDPKSRNVFAFHRPETLVEYLGSAGASPAEPGASPDSSSNLNTRLANLLTSDQMPKSNLWSA